jgi:hypothetical protein
VILIIAISSAEVSSGGALDSPSIGGAESSGVGVAVIKLTLHPETIIAIKTIRSIRKYLNLITSRIL